MLISLLLRLIATIFAARPPGIEPGQWSPHARDAVRLLEGRYFRIPVPRGSVRRFYAEKTRSMPVDFVTGEEGAWTCKP